MHQSKKTLNQKEMKNPVLEQEANLFACRLLMPRDLFLRVYKEMSKELTEDELILGLAKAFEVPIFAIVWRMVDLKDNLKAKE